MQVTIVMVYNSDMKIKQLLCLLPLVASISGCSGEMKIEILYEPKPLDVNVTYDDVYLIMGQSNASGVSPHIYLKEKEADLYQKYSEGNSKVLMSFDVDERIQKEFVPVKWGYGHSEEFFGPEIGIAETLSQKEETSYIIKASYSGSCLLTQYVKDTGQKLKLYNRYIEFIKQQLKLLEAQGKTPRVRGLFWMQGESDASLYPNSKKYLNGERYFINYLRSDLNDWIYDYFNFVDAYICSNGIWNHPEIINSCKEKLSNEEDHFYCIKTNGEDESAIKLSLKYQSNQGDDSAHYDAESMLLLGKTAGQYIIK